VLLREREVVEHGRHLLHGLRTGSTIRFNRFGQAGRSESARDPGQTIESTAITGGGTKIADLLVRLDTPPISRATRHRSKACSELEAQTDKPIARRTWGSIELVRPHVVRQVGVRKASECQQAHANAARYARRIGS